MILDSLLIRKGMRLHGKKSFDQVGCKIAWSDSFVIRYVGRSHGLKSLLIRYGGKLHGLNSLVYR